MSDTNNNTWVKPFEEPAPSLKTIGKASYGIIDTKEEYCYKHKAEFTNEHLKLPSGKTTWLGCPMCKIDSSIKECRKGVPIEKPVDTLLINAQKYAKVKGA